MLCRDFMKVAKSVSPGQAVEEAARLMRDFGIGFLPVCDESSKVIGTLTDRDIAVRSVASGESPCQPIEEVMTPEVVACRSDEDIAEAEELMSAHQVSRMICVDEDGRMEGVLSLSDIAQVESRSRAAETLREVSQREGR